MQELYVSPTGKRRGATGAQDSPFATLEQALSQIRLWKQQGQAVHDITVWLRGGEYQLEAPVRIGSDDSAPISIKAFPGEKPVFSGGRRISGFKPALINGVAGWRADLPKVAGDWNFNQLFVNGKRKNRSRYPQTGFLWIEQDPDMALDIDFADALFHGNDRFHYAAGDIKAWRNLRDIDILVHHFWIQERLPLESVNLETRLATFQRRSVFGLKDDVHVRYAKYFVENVYEEMRLPGQWYLDRSEKALYYIPEADETIDTVEVVAPMIPRFIEITGDARNNRYVEHLAFTGITFRYGAWIQPSVRAYLEQDLFLLAQAGRWDKDFAESPQAASHVPGCLFLTGARHVTFCDCVVEHVGWYAFELAEACHGIRILHCLMRDLGAGGVKINGGNAESPVYTRATATTVADCTICDGGRLTLSAVGILSMHAAGNAFLHNHIHDFYYSGISCGWVWGYAPSSSHHNTIEWNHIHDLGKGMLSDMGGIYTLGEQPGTTIRFNYIHDVTKSNYGGWGVYLDEGSSHILVACNLCVNLSSQGFHQHYGRENIVRNNVFAYGQEAQLAISRLENHVSLTLERNILLADGKPIFSGAVAGMGSTAHIQSDLNLFYDQAGQPVFSKEAAGWDRWRQTGLDRHSLFADPGLAGIECGDLACPADSPALSLGFEPFTLKDAGPRSGDNLPD